MQLKLYIHAAAAISPQPTFDSEEWKHHLKIYNGNFLTAIEPNYQPYINPVAIRRMGRVNKMGIAAGMKALQLSGDTTPSAIITGTGRGSMSNTQGFIHDLIQYNEEALNPTNFIQSTYNNINGWLALQTKSKTYNQTFVHRGSSFEWALIDTFLYLNEEPHQQEIVLVGGFDELTEEYFKIRGHLGLWKNELVPNNELIQSANTPGTIAGEGATFFCLHHQPNKHNICLEFLDIQQGTQTVHIETLLDRLQSTYHFIPTAGDVLITGRNGDLQAELIYDRIKETLSELPEYVFKNLCGDYDTASAFGLFVAYNILVDGQVPETLYPVNVRPVASIKRVLLINHFQQNHLSVLLLTKS